MLVARRTPRVHNVAGCYSLPERTVVERGRVGEGGDGLRRQSLRARRVVGSAAGPPLLVGALAARVLGGASGGRRDAVGAARDVVVVAVVVRARRRSGLRGDGVARDDRIQLRRHGGVPRRRVPRSDRRRRQRRREVLAPMGIRDPAGRRRHRSLRDGDVLHRRRERARARSPARRELARHGRVELLEPRFDGYLADLEGHVLVRALPDI